MICIKGCVNALTFSGALTVSLGLFAPFVLEFEINFFPVKRLHFCSFERNFALVCFSSGNATALKAEITMRIMYNKTAWKVIEQTGGPTGIDVEVTADYPMVSLVAMIFPSPDWFVGIRRANLCDGGMWRDSWNITTLLPWDAGTEDGGMFNINNSATVPVQNITLITKDTPDTPFMGANSIATLGRLMFKRVNKPVEYSCSGKQEYKLTFEGTWSKTRQPVTTFPENAHFSPLVGCTHKYNYKFWSPMTMASQGVKEVAETGTLRNFDGIF